MNTENKQTYFILDIIIFAGINAIMLFWLYERHQALPEFNWFKVVMFGLAIYRLANIISNEEIAKPIRAPFVEEVEEGGNVVEKPLRKGFKGAMGQLIYCPSCTGTWVSMVLVYAFIFWPNQTFIVVLLFAFSGFERIISCLLGVIRTEERVIKKQL